MRRIVEATIAAHAEQGIAATSIQDVARRADVALGVVYRHFPTLEELVGACCDVTFEWLELVPPKGRPPSSAAPGLERSGSSGSCARWRGYTLAAVAFRRVREACDFLPIVREGHEQLEASLDALVAAALRPLRASDGQARGRPRTA